MHVLNISNNYPNILFEFKKMIKGLQICLDNCLDFLRSDLAHQICEWVWWQERNVQAMPWSDFCFISCFQLMEIYRRPNEQSFATVTLELKKGLWPVSRGNWPNETLGNASKSKGVKTSATRHCKSKSAHHVPKQNKL